jgi:hypothetical protein
MRKRLVILLVVTVLVGPALSLAQDTYRTAYDRGYADGNAAGDADRLARRPFDFANKAGYQDGLHGFDPQIHQRDVYLVAYRRGFEDGYEVGYGLGRTDRPEAPPTASSQPPSPRVAPEGRTVLPQGTEMLVRLTETLTTQRNEAGDRFRAELVRAIRVENDVVVPAGSRLEGTITHLKRPGRIRGRAEMSLSFERLVLPDDTVLPIQGTVVSVEPRRPGEVKDDDGTIQAPGEKGEDMKKVGAAAGIGALIGILTGGGGGARTGGVVGAVAGVTGVLATRGSDLLLPAETELMIRLERDLTVPTGILRPEKHP